MVIAVTASFVTGLFVYFYQTSKIKGNDILLGKGSYQDIQKYMEISDLEKIINDTYYRDVEQSDLVTGTLKGMVESLNDPYSVYYDEEETKSLYETTEGEYQGIGAVLSQNMNTGIITLVQIYDDSPAMLSLIHI